MKIQRKKKNKQNKRIKTKDFTMFTKERSQEKKKFQRNDKSGWVKNKKKVDRLDYSTDII